MAMLTVVLVLVKTLAAAAAAAAKTPLVYSVDCSVASKRVEVGARFPLARFLDPVGLQEASGGALVVAAAEPAQPGKRCLFLLHWLAHLLHNCSSPPSAVPRRTAAPS